VAVIIDGISTPLMRGERSGEHAHPSI